MWVKKGEVNGNLGREKADGNGSKPSIVPHISSIYPHEKERAAETVCDELTVTPIPHPPVLLWRRQWRNQE